MHGFEISAKKNKTYLTSLHHYIFVETDTLFLEWLTFRSMGKWCVEWFKLHLGCNQDSCLIYGFLELQDVLLKSNKNWEKKKLCFKNLLTIVHFCYMIDNTTWFYSSKLVVFFIFWCAGLAIKNFQLLKPFIVNFA